MELNNLIPHKYRYNINWVVKGNYLMYEKYDLIPLAFIQDDIVYVILENKLPKEVIRLTQHLLDLEVEFYFTTPEITNPSGIENLYSTIIKHYFYSYSQARFYEGFKKIEFDLIKNMVDWAIKFKHDDLIKENYEIVHKEVNFKSYDWYGNKYVFICKEEIRQEFDLLYREIQINRLINR